MEILKQDKRPLYLKIKEHIENLIDQEIYEAGDKLPSETAFAKKLDVSRASLREALRVLEKEGKILGATNIPLQQLPENTAEFPGDKEIYIFCSSGVRSMIAASILRRKGYKKLNVILGGIQNWNSKSCPLER